MENQNISPAIKDSITTFYIEITNACNLACTFCPYPKMNRSQGVMDIGLFKRVADEIAEKQISSWICLHLMGEPTLHPRFFEMVEYLSKRDLAVSLITNGSIPAERLARGLDGVKIAALQLSINSFGEEQYVYKGVKHMDYTQYVENQKMFIDAYTRRNPNTPVSISYLLTQDKYMAFNTRLIDSNEEMLDVLRFWMDYAEKYNQPDSETGAFPANPVFFSKTAYLNKLKIITPKDLNRELTPEAEEPIFRIAPSLFVYFKSGGTWHNQLLDDNLYVKKKERGSCQVLEKEFAVLWNGDTTFCCGDYEGRMDLGNVREHTIEEILRSDKVRTIRADNKKMIYNQEVCQVCKGDVYEKETDEKVVVSQMTLIDKFRTARSYYKKHGANALAKKIISKAL
uniref:Radical SAM domain protein n=1 Tax=uncultured bacterium W4-21b TaxID=1130993 RepID=H9BWP8_9BACT|nr:radical SAM domain protein [uncultured bacterium W4-21b]